MKKITYKAFRDLIAGKWLGLIGRKSLHADILSNYIELRTQLFNNTAFEPMSIGIVELNSKGFTRDIGDTLSWYNHHAGAKYYAHGSYITVITIYPSGNMGEIIYKIMGDK